MKKTILTVAFLATALFSSAQDSKIKAGLNLGLPMGDIKDAYSFNVGINGSYLFPISDKFYVGGTVGYEHYNGKTIETNIFGVPVKTEIKSAGFIPVAASAEYMFNDKFFGALDLGYAIGIAPSGIDSGFLYQPKIGYAIEKFDFLLGYKAIAVSGGAYSSINLGVAYKL